MALMAIIEAIVQTFQALETEILVFIIAMCTHAVVFRKYGLRAPKHSKLPKHSETVKTEGSSEGVRPPRVPGLAPLLKSIRPLLNEGADRSVLAREIAMRLPSSKPEAISDGLTVLLDTIGKAVNTEILAAVRTVLTERDLQPSSGLSERLLRGYLSLRMMSDFNTLLVESEEKCIASPGILMLALRSALSSSDLDAAVARLRSLSAAWQAKASTTPSAAPQYLLKQLACLAIEKAAVPMLLRELSETGLLNAQAFETLLQECVQRDNATSLQETEKFGREQGVTFTVEAYCALIRGTALAEDAHRVVAEATERGLATKDLMPAVAETALAHGDKSLAGAALCMLPASPAPDGAAAMLRLCEKGLLDGISVLELYEKNFVGADVLVDAQAGKVVAEAAFAVRRPEILTKLMAASPEVSCHVALLKLFAAEHRLQEALAVFEACPEKSVYHYNALLDACTTCSGGDMKVAERIMEEAITAEVADVVTYNTIIKAHLRNSDTRRARAAIERMRAMGLAPNVVTFNELIDATIKNGRDDAWAIIDEMKACGLQPNRITCSILLKNIQHGSKATAMERTLAIVEMVEDGMDEVLLSSVCEACIRAGRADLLKEKLKLQRGRKAVQVKGAHSYGSLIRGFGFIQDLAGAWEMWREMRASNIVPTAITIGCMVEALVSNSDAEAGHSLIHEVLGDAQMRPLMNAVIYGSVLKGFCHEKRFDRVWAVYNEMIAAEIQLSITTYNALIDACARNNDMVRVQPLMEDMARQGIEPNVITYSTIVKGYCQDNRLEKAFELLEEMKKSSCLHPDEITYNTVLDGCARSGLWEKGIAVLEDMQKAGVFPSNFTLSVLVKLANRSKRPEKAFELCDELCKKYHFRPNVHVYNNLVHVCTSHLTTRRALAVFEEMLSEKVRPDTRTYTLLIKGCLSAKDAQDVAGLLRGAVGLRGVHPSIARFEKGLVQPRGGLPSEFIAETLEGLASQCGALQLAMQLLSDLSCVPGIRLDSKLHMRLTSRAINGRF